jgi:hypothetical protein
MDRDRRGGMYGASLCVWHALDTHLTPNHRSCSRSDFEKSLTLADLEESPPKTFTTPDVNGATVAASFTTPDGNKAAAAADEEKEETTVTSKVRSAAVQGGKMLIISAVVRTIKKIFRNKKEEPPPDANTNSVLHESTTNNLNNTRDLQYVLGRTGLQTATNELARNNIAAFALRSNIQ